MYCTNEGSTWFSENTFSSSFICWDDDGAVIGVVVLPSWLHPVTITPQILFPSSNAWAIVQNSYIINGIYNIHYKMALIINTLKLSMFRIGDKTNRIKL